MNQQLIARLIAPFLFASAICAQAPHRATVAVITNQEGAHLSAYFPALAQSGSHHDACARQSANTP